MRIGWIIYSVSFALGSRVFFLLSRLFISFPNVMLIRTIKSSLPCFESHVQVQAQGAL